MKQNNQQFKLPENEIPDEIHEKASQIARILLSTPPKRLKEIRKIFSKNKFLNSKFSLA